MATLEECRQAIAGLADRMSSPDGKPGLGDRTLSAHVTDLDVTFSGALRGGSLVDVTADPQDQKAQIRLTSSSDDLVAMADGKLDLAKAWLAKRIRIEASMMDLIKLKTMF